MEHLSYFIILAFLAEVAGTVGGFGSSLFFVPIASYFLDFHSVLGITALFHLSSNITKIAFFKKGFDKKLVLSMGIPAMVFVAIGAYLSKFADSAILEASLGVFLIAISLVMLLFRNLSVQPTSATSVGGGVLSGFIAGMFGTGGAIRGITLAAFDLQTEAFIATSAIIDLGIDSSRSVVYFLNGYMHRDDLYLIPILLVVSIAGTWVGKILLSRISQSQFKVIVLSLVLITGVVTLVRVMGS